MTWTEEAQSKIKRNMISWLKSLSHYREKVEV